MRFRRILAVIPAVALLVARIPAEAQPAPRLGDAASFVVLGNSSVVNTGTATRITGNVGVSPSDTIEGLSDDMLVVGDIRRNDALAKSARRDSDAADADLALRICTPMEDTELGGKTFFHGVYCFTKPDVRLNGTVTFDAQGNRDAVFILRFAGALTTGSESRVLVIGNGYDGNVFWRANGAVSVGASSSFIGNIFAGSGITFGSGARISGRALTRTGSVVLNDNLLLLCCAPITVSSSAVPDPTTLGAQYRQTFSASGGMAPYTFTISSGSPPPGLALVNGALQGTLQQSGRFTFTVDATDALGCTGSAAYVIQVDDCPELESATLGATYDEALFSAGTCTLIAGAFPEDLALDGCRLKGLPKEVGTFSFTVEHSTAGARCFTLRVDDDCPIVIASPPPGIACSRYIHTFSATCAVAPYVFTAGDLPDDFEFIDRQLSATVRFAGSYSIDVTVKDALMRSHTQRFELKFDCPPDPSGMVVLPPGKVGKPYAAQLPPLPCPETESFFVPSPPEGLCVSASGAVSCTPSKSGRQEFSVIYKSKDGCVLTGKARIDVCPVITLSDLPPMVQGVDYDQTIVVSGINPPYVVTDSGLPAGIVRDGPDGLRIHGRPFAPGPYTFTITVTHPATSCVKSRTYPPTCPALEIAPAVLPDGVEGVPYGPIVFTTSGGTPPYVYSISAGSLPGGVGLLGDTLSGTPTASGPFFFTIKVTDKYGCTAFRDDSIYVVCTLACPPGVPTLSEWALWLLMVVMASAGLLMMRRVQ